MPGFKKIIVATDFSAVSTAALDTALDLADSMQATVTVVHAVPAQVTGMPLDAGAVYLEDMQTQLMDDARGQMEALLGKCVSRSPRPEGEVLSGDPATEVNRFADSRGADLVVVGTHGRTGLNHLLMGSVAEAILRKAGTPVLCVKS